MSSHYDVRPHGGLLSRGNHSWLRNQLDGFGRRQLPHAVRCGFFGELMFESFPVRTCGDLSVRPDSSLSK